MTKIVINTCYGGFGLSDEAIARLFDLKGWQLIKHTDGSRTVHYRGAVHDDTYFYAGDLDRDDPDLVTVVEQLGTRANDWASDLKVVEIPDDVQWHIREYDGREWVAEDHRTWS